MQNPSAEDDENDIEGEDEETATSAFQEHQPTDTGTQAPPADIDEHNMTRIQDNEVKLGENESTQRSQDPGAVSVLDSLLLQHRRNQQIMPREELALADVYRIRRDQDQLQYVQHLEQERRRQALQALIQQQQTLQLSGAIPLQDLYPSALTGATRQDLLLQSLLQEQQAASSIGGFRRPEMFPTRAQLSPEAESYVAALRESAAARQLQQQQSALLSGYSLPWGERNHLFAPAGRRPIGSDGLPQTSASGQGASGMAHVGDMMTSFRGAPSYGSGTMSGSLGPARGGILESPQQPLSRKRSSGKGGGWPKDRPKRPLSAYNIFFKEERARILADIPEGSGTSAGTDDDQPSTSRRRRKRNTHGKISFESLAKTIGRRWQEQTPEQVRYYKDKAEVDMQRYRSELEKYNHPTGREPVAPKAEAADEEDQKPAALPEPGSEKPQDDNESDMSFP